MSDFQHLDFPEFDLFLGASAYVGDNSRLNEKDNYFNIDNYANSALAVEAAWLWVVNEYGGGMVILDALDYGDMGATIDSQGANVILVGRGYQTYVHTSGAFNTISVSGHDYVTIRDLRIAQTSTGNANDGIFITTGSDYFRIEGCYITDSDQYGIYIAGATNIYYGWVLNNHISGVDTQAIKADMTGAVDLYYVVFSGNILNHGFEMDDLQACIISRNIIYDQNSADIGVEASQFCTISGNIMYNSGEIAFRWSTANELNSVIGNVSYSAVGDGIRLLETNYAVISGNMIYDPGGSGVEFDDSDYCACVGNTVYSSASASILYAAGSQKTTFTCVGNNIVSSGAQGISIEDVLHVLCNNNFSYDCNGQGVFIKEAGGYAIASGNYCYSCTFGVYVEETKFLCIHNYCVSNSNEGLFIFASSDNYVAFNYCIDNGAYGIELNSNNDYNVIFGNYTRGNTSGCLNVNNVNCDDNIFWANSFDEGNITDAGTGTVAFDNFDPSVPGWIATIAPPAGGR